METKGKYRIIYLIVGVGRRVGYWYPMDDMGVDHITETALNGELYDVETR